MGRRGGRYKELWMIVGRKRGLWKLIVEAQSVAA
jgi:hypothetical protein